VEVTSLSEASRGALRIEDVLPLFPDFVEIDSFRDAVCGSLEQHHVEMEELRGEMALATRTALALRRDLERVDERMGATLDLNACCARCGRDLHRQPCAGSGPSGGALPKVFLFPTGNAFHGACLCAEVAETAPPVQRDRVVSLSMRLAGAWGGAATVPAEGDQPAASVAEVRAQLEAEVGGWGGGSVLWGDSGAAHKQTVE
jgi:hypothetical protein